MNTCILCEEQYTGYGNNPAPLSKVGRCCDKCNSTRVIPARLFGLYRNTQEVTLDRAKILSTAHALKESASYLTAASEHIANRIHSWDDGTLHSEVSRLIDAVNQVVGVAAGTIGNDPALRGFLALRIGKQNQ